MLTNYLWGGWGGDDHHHHHQQQQKQGHDPKNLSSLIRDEEEKDLEGSVQDLDELADRLLTQFPAYGTNSQHYAAAGKDDEDWLRDDDEEDNDNHDHNDNGQQEEYKRQSPYHHHYLLSLKSRMSTSNNSNNEKEPTPSSSLTDKSGLLFPGMLSMSLPSPSLANTKAGNTGVNHPAASSDWDYDKQFLWKPVDNLPEKSKGGYQHPKQKLLPHHHRQRQQQLQSMHDKNITSNHPNSSLSQPYANHDTSTTALLLAGNTSNNNNTTNSNSNSSKPGYNQQPIMGNSNEHDFYNSRQHWMPDQLCKHCYLCDTPFTVFRRRHHCRLCGQVFCSSCSSFFVPSQKKGSSTLRTCQMCYEQVTEKGGLLISTSSSLEGTTKAEAATTTTTTPGGSGDGASTNTEVGANATLQGAVVHQTNSTHNNNANKTTASMMINNDHRDETGRPVIMDHRTLTTIPTSTTTKRHDNYNSNNTKNSKDGNVPDTRLVESRDNHSNNSQEQQLRQQQQLTLQSSTTVATTTTAHWRDAVQHAVGTEGQEQEAKRHLGLIVATHLEKMGEALLKRDAPLLWKEMEARHKED